jgi:hypothetical protein
MAKITPKQILFGGIGAVVTGALFEIGTKITDYLLGSALALPLNDVLGYAGIVLLVGGIIAVAVGVRQLRRKPNVSQTVPTTAKPVAPKAPTAIRLENTERTTVKGVSVPSGMTAVENKGGKDDSIEDVEVRPPETEKPEQGSPAGTEEDGQ